MTPGPDPQALSLGARDQPAADWTPWIWTMGEGEGQRSPAIAIQRNTIHLWQTSLDCDDAIRRQLYAYLSDDERQKAHRYRFDAHRHHFIVGRACLRLVVSAYLGCHPTALGFGYGDRGKPFLQTPTTHALPGLLHFNLSHSGGMALYAVACDRRVGIDLEALRPLPSAMDLAQRFFTACEYQHLSRLPLAQRELAFFRGWTRKEAYLKATGEGLAGIGTLSVPLTPDLLPTPLVLGGASKTFPTAMPTPWLLQDIPLPRHHVAALVVEQEEKAIAQFSQPHHDSALAFEQPQIQYFRATLPPSTNA